MSHFILTKPQNANPSTCTERLRKVWNSVCSLIPRVFENSDDI